MSALLLETTRGPLVEERQLGSVAVADVRGALIASAGDPDHTAYWRSSAKPFQAIALVGTGAADAFGLTPEDLAICAASHNAEPEHVSRVAALLERIGCAVTDLRCGAHPPLDPESAAGLVRRGETPTALHSNCSGKHAGMLALARHLDAPFEDYRDPAHPVQRAIMASVERATGLEAREIVIGIDGCGAPTFGLSTHRMAVAFARLQHPQSMGEDAAATRRVRDAMAAYPYLVAGRGRYDTHLMRMAGGSLVAKGGASGVQCVGIAGGYGVAVKLLAGSRVPGVAAVVATEALRQMGWLTDTEAAQLGRWWREPVVTIDAREVGETRPVFRLEKVGGS